MTTPTQPPSRDPETIIADFLFSFVGADSGPDHWRPDARRLLSWLRDEGCQVTRA